jgi:hypothetical protein
MRDQLPNLARVLSESSEHDYAYAVEAAATGSDENLSAFLASNDLWGSAGSIAGQAGLKNNNAEQRQQIEQALVQLGTAQIQRGLDNVRTAMWVQAFQGRGNNGI